MLLFSRWHRLLFVFSCLLLLVGSVSCRNAMSPTTNTTTVALPTNPPASTLKTPTSTTSTTANPGCPAFGQGRAANMPGITLGNQQEIVSYRNASGSTTINAFDVQGKTSSPIASVDGETIHSAQISQDGQWVLIVAQTNSAWALQLVRVDGQDLQTLYCASAIQKLSAQWSPNQQQIIFSRFCQNSDHGQRDEGNFPHFRSKSDWSLESHVRRKRSCVVRRQADRKVPHKVTRWRPSLL